MVLGGFEHFGGCTELCIFVLGFFYRLSFCATLAPSAIKNYFSIMKTTLISIFLLTFCSVFSQDTLKIKQIDAIVSGINSSAFQIQRDTLIKDHPEMGLKMTTYLSMVVNGGELLKYVNLVNTTMTENGATRQITTSSSFYYDRNKLIKVEEYFIEVDKKKTMDWYYAEDKPLYYSLQSDKAENRANLLLTMSETMLKQVIK